MKKTLIITGALAIILGGGAFLSKKAPVSSPLADAEVGIVGISPLDSTAAIGSLGARTISWKTAGYPENLGVDINLIQKTSDSPASYVFVRKIAANTSNDGNEIWNPEKQDIGKDLYVEVVCSSGPSGCKVTSEPIAVY